MNAKLFVYGTLMSNFKNEFAQQLHQTVIKKEKAKIRGDLYLVTNWTFSYPVADYSPFSNNYIFGELLHFKPEIDLPKLLQLLDSYEGVDHKTPEAGEYIRKEISVKVNERTEMAWAYINNKYPLHLERITSGNFLDSE